MKELSKSLNSSHIKSDKFLLSIFSFLCVNFQVEWSQEGGRKFGDYNDDDMHLLLKKQPAEIV